MRHRATPQSQRARRTLSHEAIKRSHRRGDLIRLAPEELPAPISSLPAAGSEAQTHPLPDPVSHS